MRTESRELLAVGIFGRTSLGERIEILMKRGRDFSPKASITRVATASAALLICIIASSLAPLKSEKGPVEVFVIDHVEKPDAN